MNNNRYLVMFKKAASRDPNPLMSDGWFSISIEAGSEEQALRWASHRAEMLAPWLKYALEFVRLELHHPTPELAGPYRGLIVNMD